MVSKASTTSNFHLQHGSRIDVAVEAFTDRGIGLEDFWLLKITLDDLDINLFFKSPKQLAQFGEQCRSEIEKITQEGA